MRMGVLRMVLAAIVLSLCGCYYGYPYYPHDDDGYGRSNFHDNDWYDRHDRHNRYYYDRNWRYQQNRPHGHDWHKRYHGY